MEEILKNIKAFVFDVDGVLTDGGLLADLNGEFYRTFNSKDGFGVRMAVMHGYKMGIITGGRSQSIRARFLACGFKDEDIYLGAHDKMEEFNDFCTRHGLQYDDVLYMGDDVPDVGVMMACGCGAAPSDALEDVKKIADYVTEKPGGRGCAREMIEKVMKLQGEWELNMHDYKTKF